ncbi:cytochrome P450 [Aspergillus aurantiobrunneus]
MTTSLTTNITFLQQHDTLVTLPILAAIFFILNLVLLLTYLSIIYPYFYSPFRHLPRPKGEIPLLGQHTTPYTKPLGTTYLNWIHTVPNTGLLTYRSILNQDRLLLTSPKAIAEVLVRNTYAYTKHPSERAVVRRFLGSGLTISEGEVHKFQRRAIAPVYALRNVREFYGVFWNKAWELVTGVSSSLSSPHGDGGMGKGRWCVEELNQWANRTTMDIIGLAALGKDFGCLGGDGMKGELFSTYQEIFTWAPEKDVFMALSRVLPRTLVQWLPWRVNERIDVTSTTLRDACRGLVREKMDEFRSAEGKGEDLVSRMMRLGAWEAEGFVEQLLTIIAAGHETSASAFTWACYLLAQNKPAQERLRAELREVIPLLVTQNPSSETLANTLESLPYLNAVCNEVLRFIPPVPLIRRVSTISTTILGHPIPPGTQVLLCPYAINRSPELWGPTAGEFRPERWISPETGKANNDGGMVSNYANLTFSHGPRSCIGHNFARAEMRTLLAVFVSSLRFEMERPLEEVVPVGIVSVRPRDGLRLRIEMVQD